jgi:hypothetical protein
LCLRNLTKKSRLGFHHHRRLSLIGVHGENGTSATAAAPACSTTDRKPLAKKRNNRICSGQFCGREKRVRGNGCEWAQMLVGSKCWLGSVVVFNGEGHGDAGIARGGHGGSGGGVLVAAIAAYRRMERCLRIAGEHPFPVRDYRLEGIFHRWFPC